MKGIILFSEVSRKRINQAPSAAGWRESAADPPLDVRYIVSFMNGLVLLLNDCFTSNPLRSHLNVISSRLERRGRHFFVIENKAVAASRHFHQGP